MIVKSSSQSQPQSGKRLTQQRVVDLDFAESQRIRVAFERQCYIPEEIASLKPGQQVVRGQELKVSVQVHVAKLRQNYYANEVRLALHFLYVVVLKDYSRKIVILPQRLNLTPYLQSEEDLEQIQVIVNLHDHIPATVVTDVFRCTYFAVLDLAYQQKHIVSKSSFRVDINPMEQPPSQFEGRLYEIGYNVYSLCRLKGTELKLTLLKKDQIFRLGSEEELVIEAHSEDQGIKGSVLVTFVLEILIKEGKEQSLICGKELLRQSVGFRVGEPAVFSVSLPVEGTVRPDKNECFQISFSAKMEVQLGCGYFISSLPGCYSHPINIT